MAFSPPEYCRLFAQKKAYQGGSRAPQEPPPPPPSYAPGKSKSTKGNFSGGGQNSLLSLLLGDPCSKEEKKLVREQNVEFNAMKKIMSFV